MVTNATFRDRLLPVRSDRLLLSSAVLRTSVVVGFLCLTVGNEGQAGERGQAPVNWSDVTTWMIEAESEGRPVNSDDGPRVGYLVCRLVAASSNDELYYFCGHEEDDLGSHWHQEPYNLEVLLKDKTLTRHRKFNRQAEIAALPHGSALPAPIDGDVLFLFFPVWPLKNYAPPRDESSGMVFPVNAALESSDYEENADRELIAGEWCTSIRSKSGNDRIWLAEGKELCVMRREWFDPQTHILQGRIVATRIANVVGELWMPVEVECFRFSPTGTGTEVVPRSRIVTRLSRWTFDDDVPREIFRSKLRPGTVEDLGPGKFRQISSGGTEHLDEIAAYYRGLNFIGLPQTPPTPTTNGRWAIWVLGGGVGGVLMGIVLIGFRSAQPPTAAR